MNLRHLLTKPMNQFTPEEYKVLVKSLLKERKKKRVKRGPKKRLKVRVKLKKDGSLSIVTKRKPAYVTREEYAGICLLKPENEAFLTLKEKGIQIMEHEEHDGIVKALEELPW